MGALYDYGRRLVVAEAEVEKLRDELKLYKDAVVLAKTEKNSALSRIEELEKEFQHAKDSNVEFEQLKKDYKELETSGKAHDEELTRLLSPVAQGLSEVLGIPEILPNQLRIDPLMDAATRVHSHGAKAKDVLGKVSSILSEVFEQLSPSQLMPSSLPGLVESLLAKEDLFGEYYKEKTKAGARAAITFALASGIEGDYEKAFGDHPRRSDGKKVQLKPFADRAGKLSELFANLLIKLHALKASTSTSASVAP